MKQTTKRFYGIIVAIAIVSGITGAFAFSFAASAVNSPETELQEIETSIATNTTSELCHQTIPCLRSLLTLQVLQKKHAML